MTKFLLCAVAAALLYHAAPARADDFSDDQFCTASNDAAKELEASGPQWVDKVTRADGITVDCANKSVDFKKFLKLNASDMGDGWQDKMQQAMNQMYCQDPNVGTAIQHGWTVSVSLTLQDNTQLPVTVGCGQ